MSPRLIRRLVVLVFVGGIAGMIVGSIKDSNGAAITAGIVTAMAALGLILITSVAPPGSLAKPSRANGVNGAGAEPDADPPPLAFDETIARDVEGRVQALVAAGADEEEVRKLVRRAIDLGLGSALTPDR